MPSFTKQSFEWSSKFELGTFRPKPHWSSMWHHFWGPVCCWLIRWILTIWTSFHIKHVFVTHIKSATKKQLVSCQLICFTGINWYHQWLGMHPCREKGAYPHFLSPVFHDVSDMLDLKVYQGHSKAEKLTKWAMKKTWLVMVYRGSYYPAI